jgi:hypothetical protein
MSWPKFLPNLSVSLGYRAARRAIKQTIEYWDMQGVLDEEVITDQLARNLTHELRSAGGGRHVFVADVYGHRPVALGPAEETKYGADLQLVLFADEGTKWLALQAKRLDQLGRSWWDLQDQMNRMFKYGPSRVLVYDRRRFLSADRIYAQRGRPWLPYSRRPFPQGWRPFEEVIRDFLRCWVGHKSEAGSLPPVIGVETLVVIRHGMAIKDEKIDAWLREHGYIKVHESADGREDRWNKRELD